MVKKPIKKKVRSVRTKSAQSNRTSRLKNKCLADPVRHQLSPRDRLVQDFEPYVHSIVKRLIASMHLPSDHYDEFVSAGYVGLIEAAERFNPTRCKEFKAFAYLRIRGAIIDYMRQSSDFSGTQYRYAKALKAAQELKEEEFEATTIGHAAAESQECGNNAALAHALDYAAKSVLAFRLTEIEAEEEISEDSSHINPEFMMLDEERNEQLLSIIETLPAKERLVVSEYYFNDKTFQQITEENTEFSKSWLSRLHSRALQLIKEKFDESDTLTT